MTITAYTGTVPNRSNAQSTFAVNMDDWLEWFTDTATWEINTAIAAFNFNATNSTSSTSLTIGTGTQSLTVQASKSYVEGMEIRIASTASTTNWMQGTVTSYNSTTGALVVNVTHTSGSGTIASWTISLSASLSSAINDNRVLVHTGNGFGSTNTKIRRFTTTFEDLGTAITYADSATLGATFTITEDGFYFYSYVDASNSALNFGISVNSSELTTNIESITAADRLRVIQTDVTTPIEISGILKLSIGDVVRAHTNGAGAGATDETSTSFQLALIQRF